MKYRVGSVPYVNALPLTVALDPDVEVVHAVPSELPALLDTGEAQAILVSSVDALRNSGRKMATGVCIGSTGAVESVRLFSKVPPRGIESLALDASSMTSNRLAQILLAERYHVHPRVITQTPDLELMLSSADACVLIGDIGMTAPSEGLYVLDLGEEWVDLTGKPFVWAAWIGGEGLTPELVGLLQQAAESAQAPEVMQACISQAAERPGWDRPMAKRYFEETMSYRLAFAALDGLKEFQKRLLRNGFSDCAHFPELVHPTADEE